MSGKPRIPTALVSTALLALGAVAVLPGATSAAGPHTCSGSFGSPGVLSGSYPSGVIVNGVCQVSGGQATVSGKIQVDPGGVLAAAFARNSKSRGSASGLRVNGDILALRGSIVILGCTPKAFVCLDDTSGRPSLSSHAVVTGSLQADSALSVLVYNTSIGHSVVQRGGGGGARCTREGPFARFGSTVFSGYQGDTVSGQLRISGVMSCFLEIRHVRVKGTVRLVGNRLANPDAMIVAANHIGGNLGCRRNSHVWDSEGYQHAKAYPRKPEPNTVKGARSGQCTKAAPVGKGQPAGPGPF